jgi:tRNA (adenine57-N1/adenine58-N1)-methyltransferase
VKELADQITADSYIILSLCQRKTYLVKVEQGKSFHTHKGYVKFDDIIGKEYGTTISSSLGFEFVALKPQLRDYIM